MPALEKVWSDDRIDKRGSIQSFPYYRAEVEDALSTFNDAGGGVALFINDGRYRKCSCTDNDGKKFVCVPPEAGWMCERPSWLLRKTSMLEQHLTEKRRQKNESAATQRALEASENASLLYLKSEEGMAFIHICTTCIVNHLRSLFLLGCFDSTPTENLNALNLTEFDLDMSNHGRDAISLEKIYTSEISEILQGKEEARSKSSAFNLLLRVTKMDFR